MIKTKKGFTLIELLIVIAVIGILAAAIMPNLLSVRKKAQQSNFISYAKAIQAPLIVCCDQKNVNSAAAIKGGSIGVNNTLPLCSPDTSEVWSGKVVQRVVQGAGGGLNCQYGGMPGNFSVRIDARKGAYGDCQYAIITNDGVKTFGASCAGSY